MSLFGDLDASEIADDPFDIPNDVYEATISKAEVVHGSKNNPDKDFLVITYTLLKDGVKLGQVQDWFSVPEKDDKSEPAMRSRSFIKARLIALNVPESAMNTLKPEDLIGTDCYVQTKKNDSGFPGVQKVTMQSTSNTSSVSGSTGNMFG